MRQRVSTGGSVSAYYTYARENLLGIAGGDGGLNRHYLTLEFVQNLLKGIGDKEQQGAIENAMLAVQDSEENRNLVISQVVLEVVRAYWLLGYSMRNLETAQKTHAMANEVLRREHVRFSQGISHGVTWIAPKRRLPTLELVAGVTSSNGNNTLRSAENFRDTNGRSSWFVGVNFSYPLQNREARDEE